MSTIDVEHTTGSELTEAVSHAERVELTARESDSISVTLSWVPGSDVVAVTVDDAKTGDSFELVVADNERALDVFHHPFAYARARGVALVDDARGVEVAVEVHP